MAPRCGRGKLCGVSAISDSLPMVQRLVLWPLAAVYAAAVRVRNWRYDRLAGASHPAPVPTISIGNITVGGTGKTPVVIETVRRLLAMGRRPGVLSRGYGSKPPEAADEVRELRQAIPDVPIVVDPDRVAGAATAVERFGVDCLVLDDGFQHRRLRRQLDVVLIDALRPWGGGAVLPAGRLREPLSGLRRAGLFIITRANQLPASQLHDIERALAARNADAPVLRAEVRPTALVFADEEPAEPGTLAYHNVLPICGLGNPDTFLRTVGHLAGRLCEPVVFADHQHYRPRHVQRIVRVARRRGADLVVTTRKDWVKLAPLWTAGSPDELPLARLEVRLQLDDPGGLFDELLRAALEEHA